MRWIGVGLVAGMFGIAAMSKVLDPLTLARSLGFLVPWLLDHESILLTLPGLIAGFEASLALLVIFYSRRKGVLLTVAGVLGVFTLVVIVMLTRADAPSCGCFGAPSGLSPHAEHLAGLIRNVGFLLIIVWLYRSRAPNQPASGYSRPRSVDTSPAGFTLIELLVSIAIIVIIIALALPALRLFKSQATLSSEEQLGRQLSMSLTLYMNDHRESFPFFGTPGDPLAPHVIDGVELVGGPIHATKRYFTYHRWFWASAIYPSYVDAPRTDIEAEGRAEHMQTLGWPEAVVAADFQMTSNAFADTRFWSDDQGPDHDVAAMMNHLHPTSLADVTFPSLKGILGKSLAGSSGFSDHPSMPIAFGDGSVRSVQWEWFLDPEKGAVDRPWGATGLLVDSTRDGLGGIDF